MGRISPLSVLAGALCGLAAVEALVAIAGAIVVAINGGTNFGSWSASQFKTLTGAVVAAALFLGFVLAGYVAGRMSRRRGATHGLLAGVVGVVLAGAVAAALQASGADNGLARVAHHIQVADTWQQWRTFGLIGVVVAAVAIVLGGLFGGIKGEQWHGKLLARAVDPSYGPEAEERAEARKRITEAEVARLKAADHVGRLTATSRSAEGDGRDDAVTEPTPTTAAATTTPPRTAGGAVLSRSTHRATEGPTAREEAAAEAEAEAGQSGRHRPRHLLGRR
jgi:hypothetical protein